METAVGLDHGIVTGVALGGELYVISAVSGKPGCSEPYT